MRQCKGPGCYEFLWSYPCPKCGYNPPRNSSSIDYSTQEIEAFEQVDSFLEYKIR